jgi:hypothetical protein
VWFRSSRGPEDVLARPCSYERYSGHKLAGITSRCSSEKERDLVRRSAFVAAFLPGYLLFFGHLTVRVNLESQTPFAGGGYSTFTWLARALISFNALNPFNDDSGYRGNNLALVGMVRGKRYQHEP